ncbi:MAG: arylsulfatase [Gammaproteobacteria bacterium]|nr:arylsulfatase [Gammaproteobacteria bacterium]
MAVSTPSLSAAPEQDTVTETQPPNIVLLLADDLGFSDLASYGSEISTPTLDILASQGVRFSNFHVAANCAPTRAMLMTGVNNHRAGVGNIIEMIPDKFRGSPSYQGTLSTNTVTVATLLRDAGYHTYMAGKWHLGQSPELLPSARGYERTVALADSGADNWEQKPYMPIYDQANWFADGERFDLPEDFYSSRFLIDKIIEFVDSNAESDAPFFAYVPFQAVHIPVQAPQAFIDRYEDTYKDGWEVLRARRYQAAKTLGLVPENSTVEPMASTQSWQNLEPETKRYQAKRMAVYAAMVEAMDFHIGRLIQHLKDTDRYDNTIFIFASDNGSEGAGINIESNLVNDLMLSLIDYNDDYETLGLKGSFNTIGPNFASAAASPLSFYKFYVGEGGLRVPLIIAGEPLNLSDPNSIIDAFSYATDIVPTILQMTGVPQPNGRYNGREVEPIVGRSVVPLLEGQTQRIYGDDDAIGYELNGHRALFLGDHKIVYNRPPIGDGVWHLYNIATDPGETQDLRDQQPQRFAHMQALYEQFVVEHGVLPVAEDFDPQQVMVSRMMRDRFGGYLIALVCVVVALVAFGFYRRRRLRTH